jgi:two-component system, cell cycle response regulator
MEKLDISILYVEDDPLISETTQKVLSRIVNKVFLAFDGLSGLDMYKKFKPDIVLTDLNLPNIDGLTLAKFIIATDKNTPVVIITSHSDINYLLEAIKTRVHGFIIKPFDLEFIYQLFAKLTRELQLSRELEKNIKQTQTLLDFQVDMIFMTDGEKVIKANKKFLDFTYCYDINEFNSTYQSVSELFLNYDGYIIDDLEWLANMQNTKQQPRVKMKDIKNDSIKTYLLKYNRIPDENIFIISFIDITEIEKKTLSLEKDANIDVLTGLFNRRRFNEMYKLLLESAKENNEPLSMIVLDVDHFKSVNDTFGHEKGDIVLKEISYILKNSVRSSDIISRWGGEEFVMILPKTPVQGATILADKIRKNIEIYRFSIDRKLTISLGISGYRLSDAGEELFGRADTALILAKNSGRNCIKVIE